MLICDFKYQSTGFSLDVQLKMQSQLLGIIGVSGSGKSTLLKNIVGLLQPSQGSIYFNNDCLFDQNKQIVVPTYQRNIALIFQNALLFPHMNVRQNLTYSAKWAQQLNCQFSFDYIVQLLELQPLLNRKAQQLSGGEAQRVSIGRALLSSPRLLLLDEPLTGLDTRLKQQILAFLKTIKDETGLPILYVTHHHEELAYLQGEIVCVEQGKVQQA